MNRPIHMRCGWTAEDAIQDALSRYPDCTYAEWDNGLNGWFQLTYVVKLWRNEDCWAAGDPPRHVVEGYTR